MITVASFIDFLQSHEGIAYLILFLGSYFETLIGSSFFLYGEFIFLPGAILAGAGILNIWLVSLVCISGGILGDSSSYFIGKKYGKRVINFLFRKKHKHLNEKNYKKAKAYFRKHGKKSIFFARLLGPLSWITPFLAGTMRFKYSDFVKYNIPGVIIGIGEFLVAGYVFGLSYALVLPKIQEYVLLVVIGMIILISGIYIIKKRIDRMLIEKIK